MQTHRIQDLNGEKSVCACPGMCMTLHDRADTCAILME